SRAQRQRTLATWIAGFSMRLLWTSAIGLGLACLASAAPGQDFYRNKQVRLIVGHPVGNDHDVGGRLLARYLGKHIPGHPGWVVQNVRGGAGVPPPTYASARGPRDAPGIGPFSPTSRSQAMIGQPTIEAAPRRFQWLGAPSFPARICPAATAAAV